MAGRRKRRTKRKIASTYPHQLPVKLLSVIFILCTPPHPRLYHDAFPLGLLWVCKRWRHVAQNTPQLWEALEFEFYDQRSRRPDQLLNLVVMWIEGSSPLPISMKAITTEEGIVSSIETDDPSWEKIEEIARACDRWKAIKGEFLFRFAKRIVDAANTSPCSRMAVEVIDQGLVKRPFRLPDVPEIDMWVRPMSFKLEGTRKLVFIRHVKLATEVDIELSIQLIACALNLETLRLHIAGSTTKYQGDPLIAQKLQLIDFHFSCADSDGMEDDKSHILRSLTAPSLLELCTTDMDSYPQFLLIKDFLKRSKCPLRRFYFGLECEGDSLRVIHRIYRNTPSLEAVGFSPLELEDFEQYLVHLGSKRYLPHLTSFTFAPAWFTHRPILQPLKNFSKRRCRSNGGKLEKIIVLGKTFKDVVRTIAEQDH